MGKRELSKGVFVKFCMLASSSSGNCSVIQSADTTVLVDAGISAKRTFNGLTSAGLGEQIDAIFISHEHSDHCKELGVVAKRFGCPIYGTEATLSKLEPFLKGTETLVDVKKRKAFQFKDLEVMPFSVSHDAIDPCGYTFYDGKHRAGVATDLGIISEEVQDHLSQCDAVSFEANHDVEMLENGHYPQFLKDRITGPQGHLSNHESGQGLALMAMKGQLKHAILAHLSGQNNRPDLALKTVQHCLRTYDLEFNVLLSHKSNPSPLIEL